MARKKKKTTGKIRKFIIAFLGIVVLFTFILGYSFYHRIYAPNVDYGGDKQFMYVPTGTDYAQLLAIIAEKKIVRNIESFNWVAARMSLPENIHAGRYRLSPGMSNYELVKNLRSGKQEPVNLVINKFRLKQDLAGFVSHKLEADSTTLLLSLNDAPYLREFELTPETAMTLFIPNTYEFYWNTSAAQFMERMKKERDRFWTEERKNKAAAINLSPEQVITLASIVEEETNYNPEKSRMAGVYLNRLHQNMKLQADPTVKFALKDFSITRILNIHLAFPSPYNTYQHVGLPPGPICTPSVKTIDAVLNAEQNDYLYFCANPDKPGTHSYARTMKEHELNALKYQRWLSQRGSK